jgi:hypothetical protein
MRKDFLVFEIEREYNIINQLERLKELYKQVLENC